MKVNLQAKSFRPTIRITARCTQSCGHCCFSSSPQRKEMMSVDTAREVSRFLVSNKIIHISVMGGEFFLNPSWYEILNILRKGIKTFRLVTNGDWAEHAEITEQVVRFVKNNPCMYLSIGKDDWHTNKNVDRAVAVCKENDLRYNVATEEKTGVETLVPIGRAESIYNAFSLFTCYCRNPEKTHTFLIDEEGKIYKCVFGIWDYADIFEYADGGFFERFKEFNSVFYSAFVANCKTCSDVYYSSKKRHSVSK